MRDYDSGNEASYTFGSTETFRSGQRDPVDLYTLPLASPSSSNLENKIHLLKHYTYHFRAILSIDILYAY